MKYSNWIHEREEYLEKEAELRRSNLSPGQRSYLYQVLGRDYAWTTGDIARMKQTETFPTAMSPAVRQRKEEALPKLRGALTDLALLARTTVPSYRPEGLDPWFDMDNARYVLDKDLLCEILNYAMRHLGQEYADAFLQTIGAYYSTKGEEIVVQRKIGYYGLGIR